MGRRTYSDHKKNTVFLLGGGLEKFQGRFKEEQYFCANDRALLAKIQKSGYQFKCETATSDWSEYERMANEQSELCSLRMTSMLNKNRNCSEEAYFLQEQKGLLERVLELLKRLSINRQSGPPYSPHPPFGSHYPYGPYHQQPGEKTQSENPAEENKSDGEQKDQSKDVAEQVSNSPQEEPDVTDLENREENNYNDHNHHGNGEEK